MDLLGGGVLLKIIFFPLYLVWGISIGILKLTGRLVGVFLGLALFLIGILFTLTLVGAIIGIPLILIGMAMILKSIFYF